ncbi:MAG TPA: surface-adhesin E family protein [Thermodesulfobacteriota bacterium]|nr:surface-adhesin E family protein [Thermodesulfobacteriota bacterium]
MKSLSVKLGVILIGFSIFSYVEVWGADWKYFAARADGILYWYDAQGVTYRPNNVIQVWVKKVKADEIMRMVESGTKITASELEQMTLGRNHDRSLIEIDCVENTFHILQRLNYDSKGVLKSGESSPGGKKPIVKNSAAERLYQAVCK